MFRRSLSTRRKLRSNMIHGWMLCKKSGATLSRASKCELTERVDILQPWEAFEDGRELFSKRFLCVFDLPCIETFTSSVSIVLSKCDSSHRHTPDPANLEPSSDLCGKTPLRATQNDVEEFLTCRYRLYLFPSCLHGGLCGGLANGALMGLICGLSGGSKLW